MGLSDLSLIVKDFSVPFSLWVNRIVRPISEKVDVMLLVVYWIMQDVKLFIAIVLVFIMPEVMIEIIENHVLDDNVHWQMLL